MDTIFMEDDFPAGCFVFSPGQGITHWNAWLTGLTGIRREEITGKGLDALPFTNAPDENMPVDVAACLDRSQAVQKALYAPGPSGGSQLVHVQGGYVKKLGAYVFLVSGISQSPDCGDINEGRGGNTVKSRGLVGNASVMQQTRALIEYAADSDATVLISGESGTGKEVTARAIHDLSSRGKNPFIAVNCSALSGTLLESELFGHVKGSFTGAYRDKKGVFEAAHGGTLFLDELGDISRTLQVKLLRVIQERTVTRVGDTREVPVDIRIIGATNKNLREEVAKENFREDFFYRVNVFPIRTPSLREHKNDIPVLLEHIISKQNKKYGKVITGLDSDAMRLCLDYCWPGNVRELENAIEHAFVVADDPLIGVFDLPQDLRVYAYREGVCKPSADEFRLEPGPTREARSEQSAPRKTDWTAEEITYLLDENEGNKTKVAKIMGMSRVGLWKKLKRMGLDSSSH